MIGVDNLKMEFGARLLFDSVSFVINDRERVCLVGRNGAGKSTLMKILAGQTTATNGRVLKSQDCVVGYLPQVVKIVDKHSLWDEVETVFVYLHELEQQLSTVRKLISEAQDYESLEYGSLLDKANILEEQLVIEGVNQYKSDMERILIGLGFRREDFCRNTSEFSGGWRMRIELAKLLLQKPDVLLLDEPTNHLDIESITWLENFLIKENKGSVIVVSHDRTFINNVTSRTLEISCGRIVDYKVKYNDYLKLREERREQQVRAYENQQKEILSIKEFIERFRYQATKAVQVQSRIKQLEKIVPIEIDEVDTSALHLKFNVPTRSGEFPLICSGLSKNYGSHNIFNNVNITIKRGEKVALVGRNGEGKSTFVKCIMGEVDFDGQLKIGHNVEIGYYVQNQANLLNNELTVFDTIDQVATGEARKKINDILGAFMFGGEASEKKVAVLSGGERSRLAMIRLLLEPVNVLVLDEPTNHLDIQTKDVLKKALKEFEGTVLVVSHDRDFLEGLVDKVYEFRDGKLREHLGGIDDFLLRLKRDDLNIPNSSCQLDNNKKNDGDNQGQLLYKQQKEIKRKRNMLEKQISDVEAIIIKLENDIKQLEQEMCVPESVNNNELFERHHLMTSQLNDKMKEWEDLSEIFESLENY